MSSYSRARISRCCNPTPANPSLHFKQIGGGKVWSVRVGLYYRALGATSKEGVHWFWIGTHGEYDKLVG